MFFITCHLLVWTLTCHHLFQNKVNKHVKNFGWSFNKGKGIRKTLIRTLQYFADNKFVTLITGHFIRKGCVISDHLIEVQLYQ